MSMTVNLDGIEAAALEIVAEHRQISPDRLLRNLIREAAIRLVTDGRRREPLDLQLKCTGRDDRTRNTNHA